MDNNQIINGRGLPNWRPIRVDPPPSFAKPRNESNPLAFMREVIKDPKAVGAIAPTSAKLARSMVDASNIDSAMAIIELGAGAGAVTREILRSKHHRARLLAIERNPALAATLRTQFPQITVANVCASELGHVAKAASFSTADSILSALPWTSLPAATQSTLLKIAHDALSVEGIFTTFACFGLHLTPSGRSFRQRLEQTFARVEALPVVWSNLPPAFVYRCTKSTAEEFPTQSARSDGRVPACQTMR